MTRPIYLAPGDLALVLYPSPKRRPNGKRSREVAEVRRRTRAALAREAAARCASRKRAATDAAKRAAAKVKGEAKAAAAAATKACRRRGERPCRAKRRAVQSGKAREVQAAQLGRVELASVGDTCAAERVDARETARLETEAAMRRAQLDDRAERDRARPDREQHDRRRVARSRPRWRKEWLADGDFQEAKVQAEAQGEARAFERHGRRMFAAWHEKGRRGRFVDAWDEGAEATREIEGERAEAGEREAAKIVRERTAEEKREWKQTERAAAASLASSWRGERRAKVEAQKALRVLQHGPALDGARLVCVRCGGRGEFLPGPPTVFRHGPKLAKLCRGNLDAVPF